MGPEQGMLTPNHCMRFLISAQDWRHLHIADILSMPDKLVFTFVMPLPAC